MSVHQVLAWFGLFCVVAIGSTEAKAASANRCVGIALADQTTNLASVNDAYRLLGARCLRIQLCPIPSNVSRSACDADLARFDALLPALRANGQIVVLDLHSQWGKLGDVKYRGQIATFWRDAARKYRGDSSIRMFELLNEPRGATSELRSLYSEVVTAIRGADPERRVGVSGIGGGTSTLTTLGKLPFSVVTYVAHLYAPHRYTHQQVDTAFPYSYDPEAPVYQYPGRVGDTYWDKARLRQELTPIRDFKAANNVPIWITEFSCARWAPGCDRYLTDSIALFEASEFSWSYHAWRESSVWSLEATSVPSDGIPSPMTGPRMSVVIDAMAGRVR